MVEKRRQVNLMSEEVKLAEENAAQSQELANEAKNIWTKYEGFPMDFLSPSAGGICIYNYLSPDL